MLPSVLVGRGAEDWAEKRGIELCEPTSLVTKRSQQQWREAREIVKGWEKEQMDTVGAVSVIARSSCDLNRSKIFNYNFIVVGRLFSSV